MMKFRAEPPEFPTLAELEAKFQDVMTATRQARETLRKNRSTAPMVSAQTEALCAALRSVELMSIELHDKAVVDGVDSKPFLRFKTRARRTRQTFYRFLSS